MASVDDRLASRRRKTLTNCFDELYFCYSPVHQIQQYYRIGELDDCRGKWSALMEALFLKTKSASKVQEILEARDKSTPHIWNFRTSEEAGAYWRKLYGHLNDME